MSTMKLEWHGPQRKEDILRAVRGGFDETTALCVAKAKARAPRRTTILQGSIQMRPAHVEGDIVKAEWGSYQVNYAKYVHGGTRPHIIRPRTAKALYWPGAPHPIAIVHHPGTKPRPFLTDAADEVYPGLMDRIKRRMPA